MFCHIGLQATTTETYSYMICQNYWKVYRRQSEQDIHARQIWILWIFTSWDTWKYCVCSSRWQTGGTSASQCGCPSDYPKLPRHVWKDVPAHVRSVRRALDLMEDIFGISYKCTPSAITRVSGHMFTRKLYIVRYLELVLKFVQNFHLHPVYPGLYCIICTVYFIKYFDG
jgi:hypothetical protein